LEYSRQPLQMSRTEGHVQNAKGFKSWEEGELPSTWNHWNSEHAIHDQ
jgi:hypothetical protein